MSTHEIIEAEEMPAGVRLKIQWREPAYVTTGFYSTQHAKALGWQRPDPQPVDPAWMVEVVREAVARTYDAVDMAPAARDYRAGERDDSNESKVAADTLRLALSRGHVVLAPVMPSEEEMLRDAREDVLVRALERIAAYSTISGMHDQDRAPKLQCIALAALQARRNVYASLGAVAGKAVSSGPAVPEVDLRSVLTKAWEAGWNSTRAALCQMFYDADKVKSLYEEMRRDDVSAILENLKSGEA